MIYLLIFFVGMLVGGLVVSLIKRGCGGDVSLGGMTLSPHVYAEVERYRNVTVSVMRCIRCGETEILWCRQEDTEEILNTEDTTHAR